MAMKVIRSVDAPYDEFCPSVHKDIPKRVCQHCQVYFTSAAAVGRHRKGCPSLCGIPIPKPTVLLDEEEEEDEVAQEGERDVDDDMMPVISIEDILNRPFMEIEEGQGGDEELDD